MNYNERAELQKLSFIWQQDRRWVLQGRFDRKGMFGLGGLDNQDLKQQRERVIPWGENSIIQVMETHDKLKENLIIPFGLSAECFRRNEQDRVGGRLGMNGRSTTIFLIIMSSLKVLSMFCRHSECLETDTWWLSTLLWLLGRNIPIALRGGIMAMPFLAALQGR